MSLPDGHTQDDQWGRLQQPPRPAPIDPHYRLLLAALDGGWQIEEPVSLRPRWGDSAALAYHFVLRRAPRSEPQLIAVTQSTEVDRFIRAAGLRIAAGH